MNLYPKHALVLAALFAVTIPASAQQLADTEQRDQPRQHATRGIASPNAFRPEVVSNYESMGAIGINARRELYSTFSREMRRDLWPMHLDHFVAGNPTLTPNQALVVSDAYALIAFGFFENTTPGAAGSERWLEALSALEARGRLAFSPKAARLLFFELGGPSEGLLDFSQERDTCSCSSESDWCDWITNPDPNCVPGGPNGCTRTAAGCGTWFEYSCNGICGS